MSTSTSNERLAALAEQARRRGNGAAVSLDRRLADATASSRQRGPGPSDLRGGLAAHAERARERGR